MVNEQNIKSNERRPELEGGAFVILRGEGSSRGVIVRDEDAGGIVAERKIGYPAVRDTHRGAASRADTLGADNAEALVGRGGYQSLAPRRAELSREELLRRFGAVETDIAAARSCSLSGAHRTA